MIPDFSPTCRRLTPGPGYLEALQEDNVSMLEQSDKQVLFITDVLPISSGRLRAQTY